MIIGDSNSRKLYEMVEELLKSSSSFPYRKVKKECADAAWDKRWFDTDIVFTLEGVRHARLSFRFMWDPMQRLNFWTERSQDWFQHIQFRGCPLGTMILSFLCDSSFETDRKL